MTFLQSLIDGIGLGATYAVVAVGIGLVFGVMRLVNLAHGAFAMFGGYVIVLSMNRAHFGFAAALALGFVATVAISTLGNFFG